MCLIHTSYVHNALTSKEKLNGIWKRYGPSVCVSVRQFSQASSLAQDMHIIYLIFESSLHRQQRCRWRYARYRLQWISGDLAQKSKRNDCSAKLYRPRCTHTKTQIRVHVDAHCQQIHEHERHPDTWENIRLPLRLHVLCLYVCPFSFSI